MKRLREPPDTRQVLRSWEKPRDKPFLLWTRCVDRPREIERNLGVRKNAVGSQDAKKCGRRRHQSSASHFFKKPTRVAH